MGISRDYESVLKEPDIDVVRPLTIVEIIDEIQRQMEIKERAQSIIFELRQQYAAIRAEEEKRYLNTLPEETTQTEEMPIDVAYEKSGWR